MRAILLPLPFAVGGGYVADVPEQDRETPAQVGATIDGFLEG
jgi:hypothetical protein